MLKVKTVRFKSLLDKAVKGMGNNKLIPITSLIGIELKNNVLTMTTTDATNYLYVKDNLVDGEDFSVVVESELFTKLVSKITSEYITLDISEGILNITGNGSYSIELPLDESGSLIKYPNPYSNFTESSSKTISLESLKTILDTAKTSLATTLEVPCYTGYYIGDTVIATDSEKLCNIKESIFDEPVLMSSAMMDLIGIVTEDTLTFKRNDNVLVFETPTCVIYGTMLSGIEDYNVEQMKPIIDLSFDSNCIVSRTDLISTLDRMLLFVGDFDENCVMLTFNSDSVEISNKDSKSSEIIKYETNTNHSDFNSLIDGTTLMSILKSRSSDKVTIWYGNPTCIKLTDGGNVTHIVTLAYSED